MNECKNLEKCPFYHDKLAGMPAMASVYKKKFCLSDFSKCARYVLSESKGSKAVPLDLFPNQMDRAKELMAE